MAIGKLPDDLDEGGEAIFAEINITPLTDIFLVLLIIFMVGSSVAREKAQEELEKERSAGLKINLPSGAQQEIDPGSKSIVVNIQKEGGILVDEKPVSEAELDKIFTGAFATNKETQVVIRADSGVSHGRVVGIMERARTVGLTRLMIATKGGG